MSSIATIAHDSIRRAALAPSSHNPQRWQFRVLDGCHLIELRADRARRLPVNDPDDRELTLSCGCALMNLRIGAAAAGVRVRPDERPSADDPDLLARIRLDSEGGVDPALGALDAVIAERRTDRGPCRPEPIAAPIIERLAAAAEAEGAWLRPITDPAIKTALAGLIADGDARQWADPAWRRELAAWLRTRRAGDGLTVPALARPFARLTIRHLDLGRRIGRRDRRLAETAPMLAVLGTAADDTHARLAVGQALQRVLLTACADGLAASHLNQPIQVPALRPRLREAIGGPADSWPQILLRLGRSDTTPAATPRRPTADLIDDPAPDQGP